MNKKIMVDTLSGHERGVNGVAFSLDGKYLVSGSDDLAIKIWNFKKRKAVKTIKDTHDKRIYKIAITPDSEKIISCSEDGTVKLWKLKSGKLNVKNYSFL